MKIEEQSSLTYLLPFSSTQLPCGPKLSLDVVGEEAVICTSVAFCSFRVDLAAVILKFTLGTN